MNLYSVMETKITFGSAVQWNPRCLIATFVLIQSKRQLSGQQYWLCVTIWTLALFRNHKTVDSDALLLFNNILLRHFWYASLWFVFEMQLVETYVYLWLLILSTKLLCQILLCRVQNEIVLFILVKNKSLYISKLDSPVKRIFSTCEQF